MSQKYYERLVEVAQRLDELSDDLPELADLSEEIGRIAERWPQPDPARDYREGLPRYLAEIQQIVERGAEEIIYQRFGAGNSTNGPYLTINIPNHHYYDAAVLDPKAAFKTITGI